MMKRFAKEERGYASAWLICLIPGIAMFFVLVLGAATLHQAYTHAAKSLSRTVSVSVGQTERHNTIRDIVTVIPQAALDGGLANNLTALGYSRRGSAWMWEDNYSIHNLSASGGTELLNFTATLRVSMPWRLIPALAVIEIPVTGQAHILFLEH